MGFTSDAHGEIPLERDQMYQSQQRPSLEGPGTWFYQTHLVSIQKTQVPGSELPGGGQPVFQEFPGDSEPGPAPTWLSSRLAVLEARATRYLRHP